MESWRKRRRALYMRGASSEGTGAWLVIRYMREEHDG